MFGLDGRRPMRAATLMLALAPLLLGPVGSGRADDVLGREGAAGIPIADVHFHVMPWMEIGELIRRMDANGVRWAGGTLPFPDRQAGPEAITARVGALKAALGPRYIWAAGQPQWVSLKRDGGVAALQKADSPAFQGRLAAIDKDLADGAKIIGEIHVSTMNSSPNTLLKFIMPADSPTLKALLDLAAKHDTALMVHAEWSRSTQEELGRLAASNRQGRLMLAHCGSTATAEDIRAFFEKNANAVCDLSYRSPPLLEQRASDRIVFSETRGLAPAWKKLILDFPDRFMVGVDEFGRFPEIWDVYIETVRNIRVGLLANLPADVAERVAYKNAQALLRLDP